MKLKNSIKTAAIILASIVLFSSCATIVSKSIYPIQINSNPSNAKISITDKRGIEIYAGNTPAQVSLKAGAGFFSKAEYQVKFSSPGFDDRVLPVMFSLDGWYFGNILLGGVLGMLIIDPATGAMWKLDTVFINETLNKSMSGSIPEIRILDVNEIPESWKTNIVRIDE